ncbi:MAG: endonuclease/exonuclease/phosphatase family protein [Bdellovibrionales bacterium]
MAKQHRSNIQVILVGGIGGGLLALPIIGFYMICLKPIIRKLLPGCKVFVIQPAIFQTINTTANRIANLARDAFYFHGQNTLIIGHSRGALEALEAVLKNSDLIEFNMIKGLMLLSPPFKGSPLADWLREILSWIPKRWHALEEIGCAPLEKQWFYRWSFENKELQEKLVRITVLIRYSLPNNGKVCWPLIFSFRWLKRKNILSDGLVPYESQKLPWQPSLVIERAFHHGYDTCISTLSSGTYKEKMTLFSKSFTHLFAQIDATQHAPTEKYSEVRSLQVATYNVGVLKIPIWGIPFPRTRWGAITKILANKDLDIIFFQELFGRRLRQNLNLEFKEYEAIIGPSDPRNGLAILIKKSLLNKLQPIESSYYRFKKQRYLETLFGFEKGFISSQLKIDGAAYPISLINLHLTAFGNAKKLRRSQRQQILNHIRDFQYSTGSGHFIIGGDFNEPLRMPWTTAEPSFSDQTVIHKLKHKLNRTSKSENIDYILTHSINSDEHITSTGVSLDLKDETVKVQTKNGPVDLELSDHWMVRSNLSIMKDLE